MCLAPMEYVRYSYGDIKEIKILRSIQIVDISSYWG